MRPPEYTLISTASTVVVIVLSLWNVTQYYIVAHPGTSPATLDTPHGLVQVTYTSSISEVHPYPIFVYNHTDLLSDTIRRTGEWHECNEMIYLAVAATSIYSIDNAFPIIDIGANIGACTLLAAHLGFAVHAFEVVDSNVAAIRASVAANPSISHLITVHHVPLSAASGTCGFTCSRATNYGDSFFTSGTACPSAFVRGPEICSVTLDSVPMDSVISSMKMDCQGCEADALEGAEEFWSHTLVLSVKMEVDPGMERGRSVAALDWLCDHGMHLYAREGTMIQCTDTAEFVHALNGWQDIVAWNALVPADRRLRSVWKID